MPIASIRHDVRPYWATSKRGMLMAMETDRNGMAVLTEPDCLRRVGGVGVGRVAVTVGALPAVFPINYAVESGDIYFRTAPGTKLAAACRNAVVAFEVDHVDLVSHAGWSVLVVGPATEVTDADDLERLRKLPLTRWLKQGPETLVRIHATLVSGREITNLVAPETHGRTESWILAACPACGSDALQAVCDGELTNTVCTTCMACWHTELGDVYRIPWETCPGCEIAELCRAANRA
jgi:nitroimidazol reductase NimA-like FMN-containing flavoprotein (pyridoxamine 5'-phosphate oxidase superfamily)